MYSLVRILTCTKPIRIKTNLKCVGNLQWSRKKRSVLTTVYHRSNTWHILYADLTAWALMLWRTTIISIHSLIIAINFDTSKQHWVKHHLYKSIIRLQRNKLCTFYCDSLCYCGYIISCCELIRFSHILWFENCFTEKLVQGDDDSFIPSRYLYGKWLFR